MKFFSNTMPFMYSFRSRIRVFFGLAVLLLLCRGIYAQSPGNFLIGNEDNFTKTLFLNKSNKISLKLPNNQTVHGKINVKDGNVSDYTIIGAIPDLNNASFQLSKIDGIVSGTITMYNEKKAYQYYEDDSNNLFVKEVNINKVLCIGIQKDFSESNNVSLEKNQQAAPDLQSLPDSEFVVYLDFDGEVVSDTWWANGGTINAQPSGFDDEKITNIWRIMAEDFKAFDLNITTNREIYDATPISQRMMCIFTPTTDAAPGSGGVAYLNSFDNTRVDNPCWAFNNGTRSAGETGSHEVGHTLGLSHDGNPGNQYYAGHGEWSPIMGWSVNRPIGHWSKGEYDSATNSEDDLQMITSQNGFGYKPDDHGNTRNDATEIQVSGNGSVEGTNNTGIITTSEDVDMFSFITAGGDVRLEFNPDPFYPNLNIQARILNSDGEEIAISNPNRDLSALIETNLAGGTYFIEIDGTGEGNLSSGYSDYSSIGLYTISGNYPPGNNNQPPIADFEASIDCAEVSFSSTAINIVDSYLWDFGDGNTSTEQNPTHIYTASGTYTIQMTATNANGEDTESKNDFITISIPTLPEGEDQEICVGESVVLEASGSSGYVWYDSEDGENILASGPEFTTPTLEENTTYFVAGTSKEIISGKVGLENVNDADGGMHQGGFGLVFDVSDAILLNSAKVVAEGAGNRTLELRDNTGTVIETKEINIPDGESIIELNLTIPEGQNYEIGFLGTQQDRANLFRNNANVNYPYEIEDVISIKRSTAETDSQQYYYYLYDWSVTTLGGCSTSLRTPITVNVSNGPTAPTLLFNDRTNEVSIDGVAEFDGYQWYLNDEEIEGATSSVHVATEIGNYTLEVFDANGCSSISEAVTVNVLSVIDINPNLNFVIWPNPANEVINIQGLENKADQIYKVTVTNLLGQTIQSYNELVTSLDTSSLAIGLYFLSINNNTPAKFLKR